jgi:hypothetical protein
MNLKIILVTIIFLSLIIASCLFFSWQYQITINNNNQNVAYFTQELKNLNCSITNMTYEDIAKIDCPNTMGDGITHYTWSSDPNNSIRWCTSTDFKDLIGNNAFTSKNPFSTFTLQIDITQIALIKESETSYVFLSVNTVPSQTIWSSEHLGVSFNANLGGAL